MELEKLNKSQIVLLTLLVSFMTSIATGIVTVSLMEQAPKGVTETVNRVVERTVERVAPGQAAAVAATKTVVVKESDLIAESLNAVSPSLVRIYVGAPDALTFVSLGLIFGDKGLIVTDGSVLGDIKNFSLESGGLYVRASLQASDAPNGLAYLVAATTSIDGKPMTWKPASFAKDKSVIGETAVFLGGKSATRIAAGIVTAITPMAEGVKESVSILDTNIPVAGIFPGGPIIDTSGNVIGVSTGASRASAETGFIAASAIVLPQSTKEKDKSL